MLRVGDRVTDNLSSHDESAKQSLSKVTRERATHVFKEDFEDTTSLFVDETRDTLHTATTSEAANGGLCNTLDVVAKDFAMTLSTTLAKALWSKSLSDDCIIGNINKVESTFPPFPRPDMFLTSCLKKEKELVASGRELAAEWQGRRETRK